MPDQGYQRIMLDEWLYISNHMNNIKIEWESFIKNGKVSMNSIIPPEILSSWMRCRKMKVDPYNKKLVLLQPPELAERIKKNKRLIDVASPLLQEMADGIMYTGFRLDLFDKDLFLLARYGKKKNIVDEPRRDLPLGTSQKEMVCGTSAVNLAMILEKPMQLFSYEHYSTTFHQLTCVAVPIRGEDGNVIAVINVDGYCWPLHKHTLSMLIALRKTLEQNMNKSLTITYDENVIKMVKDVGETTTNAFVIADGFGTILHANSMANAMLGGDKDDIIGYSSESLWGDRNPFLEATRSQKPYINREVVFSVGDKTMNVKATLKPVFSKTGSLEWIYGLIQGKTLIRNKSENQKNTSALYNFKDIIGNSPQLHQQIRLAKQTSDIYSNILIQGESGTGKEIFAQAIHSNSKYKNGPFIAINCSAIPEGLFESELFGYEGGSFTGSKKEGKKGKFETAVGGTLFLDEINSLPMEMQAKILRAIQNKSIVRVGGTEEITINMRIISATNVDLWKMVKSEEFREDLFFRINVITIQIPPLRERIVDIHPLTLFILNKISDRINDKISIDSSAIEVLKEYNWPGNVRELENVLERSAILAKTRNSRIIIENDILSYRGMMTKYNDFSKHTYPTDRFVSESNNTGSLDHLEKKEIERVLNKNNGNIFRTSKELKMARNTLYKKISKYNIARE